MRLKGRPASPKDELAPGDLLFAEGLGTLRLLEVVGKTVRGNYKIKVEVEREEEESVPFSASRFDGRGHSGID